MDLQEVLADTREAYSQAGVDDPDLSYITQGYIDDVERNATESLPDGYTPDEANPEANLLWDVTFMGVKYYGRVLTNGTCVGPWSMTGIWRSRSIIRRCPNRNSIIWSIA